MQNAIFTVRFLNSEYGFKDFMIMHGRPSANTDSVPPSQLKTALLSCRGAFAAIGLFSAVINILMLTGSIFMLQIYDRVLPSRSVPTLIALAVLALALFSVHGLLDLIRSRLLVRIGASLYLAMVAAPLLTGNRVNGNQPLRDLDAVRSYLSGPGPSALFDLPWIPFYLAIIFAFHPLLGWTAAAGAVVLFVLTLLTEMLTRGPASVAAGHALTRDALAEASRRNSEVLSAMGMARWLGQRWSAANGVYMVNQQRVADVAGGLGTLAKLLRMALQSAVLAIGALLVIRQEASAGIIIAASILSTRALAPVDAAIANWRGLLAARQAWRRLNGLLRSAPGGMEPMPLPTPQHRLSVEGVAAVAPGDTKLIIQNVNFTLEAGQGLGVIGPSAAGKTTLARLLVGIWKPVRGSIRLDNAAIDQWSPEQFGRFIGYVPQDVELFAGTIAENISRFDPSANSDDIIAAAREAGVHDMILGLRDGYDTEVGMSGANLSAGQQQRIALARALYGKPFLVVLDEPNSNLDTDGEAALTHAILSVRKRGGIAIVIAHRSSALAGVDHILLMHPGTSPTLGPKSEVLAKLMRPLVPAETTPPTAAGQVIR